MVIRNVCAEFICADGSTYQLSFLIRYHHGKEAQGREEDDEEAQGS